MTADQNIPANAAQITTEWLTQALRSTGTIADARVISCDVKLFGEGKGFSGQIARVGLSYDVAEAGAPASLVAKFQVPPSDPEIRAAVLNARMYEREFCFYRDVAKDVALRTPRMYFGSVRPETAECLLLLEDLALAETLNMLEGCTVEDAALVLRHLATFHAAWWEHPRLHELAWLPAFDAQAENDQRQFVTAWEVFLKKVGELLPDGIALLGVKLKQHVAAVKRYLGQRPQTFLHGDFHLNNLLFDSAPGERKVTVIDWQACSRGRSTRDVAHFLITGLTPDNRNAHDLELLKQYHTTLLEHGVQAYSLEQCIFDYRFTMLEEMYFLVMVLSYADFSVNEAAGKLRDMAIERICSAVLDHQAGELLRD